MSGSAVRGSGALRWCLAPIALASLLLPPRVHAQAAQADTTALPAQEIGTIQPGQSRVGLLEAGDYTMSDGTWADVWYVNVAAGHRLAIELRSSRFSPYVQLLDPWGNKLAEEAGGRGGGSGARIAYAIREAGRYQVVVNNYSETPEQGRYTLTIR